MDNQAENSPQQFVLPAALKAEIQHEMSHYEDPRAASIEALKLVQKHFGWV
ncbi:MAG: NADH-quinone oxidoreductase subunit NuoE, partial [Plesiomonas shigelloides]